MLTVIAYQQNHYAQRKFNVIFLGQSVSKTIYTQINVHLSIEEFVKWKICRNFVRPVQWEENL